MEESYSIHFQISNHKFLMDENKKERISKFFSETEKYNNNQEKISEYITDLKDKNNIIGRFFKSK